MSTTQEQGLEVAQVETHKTKRSDLLSIDPRNIVADESENTRTDYGEIEGLMMSLVTSGQQEPLIVTKIAGTEKYRLTDGFRRMRAFNLALEQGYEIPYVKAIIGSANKEDRLFAMVITGTNKKPLTLLEEGETYKQLKNLGYEVKEIGQRVGKSVVHVYEMLKLADLPKVVKNQIGENKIAPRTVLGILKMANTAEDLLAAVDNAILAAESEAKVTGEAKVKKATNRHTGKLSMVKTLEKALEVATTKEYGNVELLTKVLNGLRKGYKPETLADYFK